MEEAKRRIGEDITYAKDQYEALIDAEALLLVTEWREFRFPNFTVMKKLMNKPLIFDGRNVYEPEEIYRQGFEYFSIGMGNPVKK